MFSVFLRIKVFPVKKIALGSTPQLILLHTKHLLLRRISSNISRTLCISSASRSILKIEASSESSSNQDSFQVSYLVKSCGLSPETAISTSRKLQTAKLRLASPEKPNSVLNLLRNLGFTKSQIASVVSKRPDLLLSSVTKTLLPKLEFLQSIGTSRADLAKYLAFNPTLLTRSLRNQIIPTYDFLKSILQSDKKVVAAMKRSSWLFLGDHTKQLVPNISVLREAGIPHSKITLLLAHFPEAMLQKNDQFKEIVDEVKEMGFDPLKSTFVLAVHVLTGNCNKKIWNRCYETYRNWGWSEDDILKAFRKHPNCMILSEKKINKAMNFLVKKMGWDTKVIARCPTILFFSYEKRIVPRCSVVQVLLLKGLIKKDVCLSSVIVSFEKYFLERFVARYEDEAPLLLSVYQGKIKVANV